MMVERPVASKTPSASAGSPSDSAPASPGTPQAPTPSVPLPSPSDRLGRWQAKHDLAYHRAETDRVKVLVEFLARPIHAHGGTEPDPDIVTAYNLAVEAALGGIRRASQSSPR